MKLPTRRTKNTARACQKHTLWRNSDPPKVKADVEFFSLVFENFLSRANHISGFFLLSGARLIHSISIFGQIIDKKPTANDIFVYTVNKYENRLKVIKLSIAELWQQNYKLRINNINDKSKKANDDKEIKSQVRINWTL
jgi:hypothetical protein